MPTRSKFARHMLFIFLMGAILVLNACQKEFQNRPTLLPTHTATITPTITLTLTPTTAPTVTPTPSMTLTHTLTPYPTNTFTATATPVPQRPARLFDLLAGAIRPVDWHYFYITDKNTNNLGDVNSLSAMLAFQLMDRGIHKDTLSFLEKEITVYYLNVQHEFNGSMLPLRLVIGGTYGKDVPISQIPADGSAYIEIYEQNANMVFEPWTIHKRSLLSFEDRQLIFSYMLLQDFEQYLPSLPDELILLAEHPVLIPADDWPEIKFEMSRNSSQAAKFLPYFTLDVYERLVSLSQSAITLAEYLLDGKSMPIGEHVFSAQYLVIVTP